MGAKMAVEAGGGAAPSTPDGRSTPGGRTWHRFHYAIGVFLVAYGGTGLAGGLLLWGDRRDEVAGYFGSGPSAGFLVLVKAVEALLVLAALAGVTLRRDTPLVAATAGWMAGFAMFAVLDVLKGRWGGLIEHLLYLAVFVVLLFLTYGLSAKARLAGAPKDTEPGTAPSGRRLTRTQEFALQAINRLPRPPDVLR